MGIGPPQSLHRNSGQRRGVIPAPQRALQKLVPFLHHLVKMSQNLPRKTHLESGVGEGLHAGVPKATSYTPRWSRPPPGVHREGSTCGCTRRLDSFVLHGAPRPNPAAEDKKVSAKAGGTGLGASPSPGPNGDFFFKSKTTKCHSLYFISSDSLKIYSRSMK